MRSNRKAILMAAIMAAGLTHFSNATVLSWDADGAGSFLGGSGTWDTVTPLWTTDGVNYVTWNNATPDSGVFGGSVGVVSIGAPITAAAITVVTNNYQFDLTGNPFTITGATTTSTGIFSVTNTGPLATFSVGTLTGGTKITGNLNLTIGGNWSPSNVNDFSGTFTFKPLAGGTLTANNTNTLGLPTSQIKLDASASSANAIVNWTTPDSTQIHTFLQNIDIAHGASAFVQMRVNGTKEVTLSGSITGGGTVGTNAGLIWGGSNQGALVLAGSNSFVGPVTMTGQSTMLILANNFALGQTSGVSMGNNAQAIGVRGGVTIANTSDISITGATGGLPASGLGQIHGFAGNNKLSNNIPWTNVSLKYFGVDGGSTLTLAGVLGGVNASGLNKIGQGTLVLTGANIYGNNNVSSSANATNIMEGTLRLDFSQAAIDSDIINNNSANINNNQSSELILAGGALEVVGRDGATNSQRFKSPGAASVGFTLNAGSSAVRAVQNGANSLTINLGRLRDQDRLIGSTVDFTLPTSGSIVLPTQTGAVGADNAILTAHNVAFATVDGTDWAATDSAASNARNIVSGATIPNFYTPNTADDLSGNADMSGGVDTQITGPKTVSSLRFHNSGARTIDLNSQTLTTGGILVTNSGNTSSTITGGTLRAQAGTLATANQDLVIIQNNTAAPLTISSAIADNTDNSGAGANIATALTKAGPGKLILSGANTYTGETHINGGMLKLQGAGTINGGKLVLQGGVLGLSGNTTFSRLIGAGAGSIQFLGSGGFAAYDGNATVNFGATFTIGGSNSIPTGSALILGATDSNGTVFIDNVGSLSAPNAPQQREVRVLDGSAAVDARFNLALKGDGGLTKTGDGLLELGAAGSFNGATIVEAGTLRLAAAGAIGTTTFVTIHAGTLDLNGNAYNANRVALNLGGGAAGTSANITTGAAGTLTFGTNVNYNGTVDNGATISGNGTMTAVRTFTVADSSNAANDLTIAAAVGGAGGLTKAGPGTMLLSASNTYTGATTVNAGTLTVGPNGAIASTSVFTNAGGTLNVIGGLAPTGNLTSNGVVLIAGNTGSTTFSRTIGNVTIGSGGAVNIGTSTFPATPLSLTTTSLNFADATAKLNITNNQVITNSSNSIVRSQLAGGNIITTVAGGSIGYIDQGGGSMKIRFTTEGDADLNGKTDTADFTLLGQNFGATDAFWAQGDFNYDGKVNAIDFNNIANGFGKSLAAAPGGALSPVLGSLVPEPASLSMLAIGLGAFGRRRRRI